MASPSERHTDSLAPLAITMGDPAGIGPEIIVKGWLENEIRDLPRIVIGDPDLIAEVARKYSPELLVQQIDSPEHAPRDPGILGVLLPEHEDILEPVSPGTSQVMAGRWAYYCVRTGVELAMAGRVAGIVTAPLNKKVLHAAGFNYPGHTELIAHLTNTPRYGMMLVGGPLKVILVTTHIPFREIAGKITKERVLETIQLAREAMDMLKIASPKIAVAALNPHAGEASLFGDEEKTCIFPAILEARAEGIEVEGPLPADTLYAKAAQGRFDIVVSQYHDQGLIPLKMLSFGQGINVTVGIPIIRTSVDHGTAYDIVGKGIAQPGSLIKAIRLAGQLTEGRMVTRT
ncbi:MULTISPECIES: 4-hydroxythreonine-4-phosphate dehydrogenase PdxA [Leptospirillum]|uniref:4-hydroxythreonine-4-phosphate dehydrogenase n=3 Tax=Leptospirillum ferriphilum TaxID=178606 RepID=A0A059XYE4_9BACT|nr:MULTISPECIES: 4-hydroxythreonine-4-phosphate dehydrogenase PdxA [Leptospirillum]EAY57348.1 MAG: 4-hydroxythreonine-4-phosphate dehydrogenase [Leptospirillum rubarum]EIJ77437.1 MAG: 4-hydroxythreonine-4-phosphate dehydrogenase [Leptospirillum sp. Group II 'C75']AFS53137.1 4-hydroxythreonine-4-phosphate dehydrogenase [Leptospirillum ferriphilum ML-04]AIA30232.1 4-hydroxythreonine-4-phosphate dehydrogenase [Leptospirillum ferriphilum YSK]AKS23864.1 4-hydroxythreonine-4-phosphate dehydrogenase 